MSPVRSPVDPQGLDAVILDLDGVITQTSRIHARAWKRVFDEFLAGRGAERPFDIRGDYARHVDGKPRCDGAKSFLDSRGIDLPEGDPSDDPERETLWGLGNRKNRVFQQLLLEEGVEVFSDTVEMISRWRERGLKIAVVSSSKNCEAVLAAAGLFDLFDARVGGVVAERRGLSGKPAPDLLLHAAAELGVEPSRAAVVEDAVAGVQAGRAGKFALVIGVDRLDQGRALREAGADTVIKTLGDLNGEREGGVTTGPTRAPESESGDPEQGNGGKPSPDFDPWRLAYEGWDPESQPLRESLCTLGNGHFATRGAAEESLAGDHHCPGTYLHGGYNRLETEIAGRVVENEDLVNWPNWLCLTFRPEGGRWLDLDEVEVLAHRQSLCLRTGILTRSVRVRDQEDRITHLVSRRIVHMDHPHLAATEWTLTPENWSGNLEIRTALDGTVTNRGVARYRDLRGDHLEPLSTCQIGEDGIALLVQTNQSHIQMAQAARTGVFVDDTPAALDRETEEIPGLIAQRLTLACERGKPLRVEKIVSLFTSRDRAISEPLLSAQEAILDIGPFEELLSSHRQAWQRLWQRCDIQIGGQGFDQMVLRLHIFHLLQTVSMNTIDLDTGVPARGLHGEAYRGHIFWDELFVFPFLNMRIPEVSRALLMYRHRRLPRARRAAREAGLRGALYPWQSGSDGREESQAVHLNPRSGRWVSDETHLQRHVNAAIAHNVWMYHQATNDLEFLSFYGAEIILEIARLWASLAEFNLERDRYEIRGVVGPDEYHTRYPDADETGLSNNAYTNVMAVWTLRCADHVLQILPADRRRELIDELGISDEELLRWDEISRRMFIPFRDDGIISQFEGFEDLEEFDWEAARRQHGDIQRLDRILEAEGDTTNRHRVSKQADVLMLFHLFSAEELVELFAHMGYIFSPNLIPNNIEHSLLHTSHGSTLSRLVHSWVLARSDRRRSWSLFQGALESDIFDIQGGTTPEGIHLGAMAGTVDMIQRGYTGLEMRGDALWFKPRMPEALTEIRLRLRHRGHWLSIHMTHRELCISFDQGGPGTVRVGLGGEVHTLNQGDTHRFAL